MAAGCSIDANKSDRREFSLSDSRIRSGSDYQAHLGHKIARMCGLFLSSKHLVLVSWRLIVSTVLFLSTVCTRLTRKMHSVEDIPPPTLCNCQGVPVPHVGYSSKVNHAYCHTCSLAKQCKKLICFSLPHDKPLHQVSWCWVNLLESYMPWPTLDNQSEKLISSSLAHD